MTTSASNLLAKIRKGVLILVLGGITVVAVDYFFREGKLLHSLLASYAGEAEATGDWGGFWRVTGPDGIYTLEIIESDSTIRDNVFHSSGKWKVISNEVTGGMTLMVESSGRQTTMNIAQKSADQITLPGGVTLNRIGVNETATVSLFGKLRGALNNTLVVAPGYGQTDSLYKAFLPVWEEYDNAIFGQVMTKHDRFWIASFASPGEKHVVVSIDTILQSINLGRYIDSEGVQGECSARFSVDPSSSAVIKSVYECMEGEPDVKYYGVLANGDIVPRDASTADKEYYDEGFHFAPSMTLPRTEFDEGVRLSVEDRYPYLESMVRGTSPEGGLYEYGIAVIREQFIAVAAQKDPISGDCDWICAVRELTGIMPLRTDVDSTTGFNYINPQFVKWVFANMVPDPSEKFAGLSAQKLFATTYRRAARIYTLAYMELYHLPGEVVEYEDASKKEGFYGPEYLRNRYGHTLADYANEKNADDDMYLHPPQAFGFWLRRGLDNTSKDIWEGLSKVMIRYDPVWFREKLKKYQVESIYNN